MRKLVSSLALALFLSLPSIASDAPTVNINTGSAEAIAAALHGVGPKKAAAIIAYREANGQFESVDELVRVHGIGKVTLEKNRERIETEIESSPDK